MTTNTQGTTKARENRLRRMAERQGYALRKSRRRDCYAPDYGELWLLRERVWGGNRWEDVANPEGSHDAWVGPFYDLDAIEAHLRGER
jgi:hypothetical protein